MRAGRCGEVCGRHRAVGDEHRRAAGIEVRGVAGVAAQTQEAVFETAAFAVILELPPDIKVDPEIETAV